VKHFLFLASAAAILTSAAAAQAQQATTLGAAADAGEGTDFRAVESGYVSITPLQIDLTNRDQMEDVTQWLNRARDG